MSRDDELIDPDDDEDLSSANEEYPQAWKDDSFSPVPSKPVSIRQKTLFSGKLFAYFFFGFFLVVGTIIAMGFAKDQQGNTAPMFVGLIVMAIGGIGLWYSSKPASLKPATDDFLDDDSPADTPRIRAHSDSANEGDLDESGPVTLEPGSTPTGNFVGCLIGTAFLHVFIIVFFSARFRDWQAGDFDLFPDIFAFPAALASAGSILGVIYAFLGLFNPKPVLTLAQRAIPLGSEVMLEWRFTGNANSIRLLTFTLEGMESAKYQRGTDTHTDTQKFYEEPLHSTTDRFEITEGQLNVVVPGNSMHSFDGNNNKIIWQLRLKGDIPLWPDVATTFPIKVIPHESAD